MDNESINDAFDCDHFLSFVVFFRINLIIQNLREDLAVVEENWLVENTDQTDALKSQKEVLFVCQVEHTGMHDGLANGNHILVVYIGQTTLLQKSSTQDEGSFVRQLFFEVSFFDELNVDLKLAEGFIKSLYFKFTFFCPKIVQCFHLLLYLFSELSS